MSVAHCPAWLAKTVGECDGVTTGREHFRRLQQDHVIPAEATPEQFARMLEALIANGILEITESPLPALNV